MGAKRSIAFYRYSLMNRGGDRMVIEYANHLAESGYDVSIVSAVDESVFHVSERVHRQCIPWRGRFGFLFYTLFKRLKFDVVIVDIIHLTPLVKCLGKLIYFAQADDVEYYDHRFQRYIIDTLYRRYFSRQKACITVSNYLTQIFEKRYGARDCRTVVNGIDLKTFYPDPDPDLVTKKQGRKAIFFMARGDRFRKGYDLAMEVFENISDSIRNSIELWVCGDPLQGDYPFTVRSFGVVSDARLRQILSSADIFFYPSRHEGFGLFPLEAMSCGSVVLTTDAVPYASSYPCIASASVGDVEGMLQLLENLVQYPELLDNARNDGMRAAKDFDLQKSKDKFLDALRYYAP